MLNMHCTRRGQWEQGDQSGDGCDSPVRVLVAYTRQNGETANYGRFILEVNLTTYEWTGSGGLG